VTRYDPPHHLKGESKKEARQEWMVLFAKRLARFPQYALKKGWEKVEMTHKGYRWPDADTIELACQGAMKAERGMEPRVKGAMPWEIRAAKIGAMVDAYVRKFNGEHAELIALAKAQECDWELSKFIKSAATLQAEIIIADGKYRAYTQSDLLGKAYGQEREERWERVARQCRSQARTGEISVSHMIPEWIMTKGGHA
jgi:hypothetical protein